MVDQIRIFQMSKEELINWIKYEINHIAPGLEYEVDYEPNQITTSYELTLYLPPNNTFNCPKVKRVLHARDILLSKETFSRVVLFPMVMELTGGQ
jgi:hypothetical protein